MNWESNGEEFQEPDPNCEYCNGDGEYWTTREDDKGREIEVMYPCKCVYIK